MCNVLCSKSSQLTKEGVVSPFGSMKNSNEIFSSSVLSSLSSQIAVIDETGIIIAVNKAWDDFAIENGATSLEHCSKGSNYFKVLKKAIAAPDNIAQQVFEGIQAVFKKERHIFELEYPCHSPNQQRWFILHVINLEGDESKVVASHHDITKRRNAEDASKASELKYRRLFESAKDGILILNAETGKITDVNPFLIDLLGYSYNEFLGKELWQIGLFTDVAESKKAFLELQKNKYIRYNDLPLRNKNGRIFNVEFVSNVYSVDNEKVIQCNIRDISDRILADVALQEREQKFRKIAYQLEQERSKLIISQEQLKEKNTELKSLSAYLRNVREEERKYLAREVHDELGQLASALKIDIDWLGIRIGGLEEAAKNRIIHANKTIEVLITTVRKIASSLRPSVLDDFGLNAALQWHCAEFQNLNGIPCIFESGFDDKDLSMTTKTELFRIAQESVTNIMRHAKASSISIITKEDAEKIYLSITDNGIGFDSSKLKATLGLIGLQERAATLHGELQIESSIGIGTVVRAVIPKITSE